MTLQIDCSSKDNVGIDEDAMLANLKALTKCAIEVAELRIRENSELSVLFASDQTLKLLNSKWRKVDKPTNVLAFPGSDLEIGELAGPILGDIVLSLETAKREASLENKTVDDHVTHLLVHAFLHLFGYDHTTDEEANQMENLERRILNELGVADPY